MKKLALGAFASAFALSGGVLAAAPAAVAAPALPALAAAKTVKVDVDGDGRKDTVKVTQLSNTRYKVAVTTAKGRKASRTITSTINQDWGLQPYWGAAKLDKVKGYELLLATGGGDGYTSNVLTWRSNKLVRQAAPKRRSSTYAWYSLGIPDWGRSGYRFYSKNGKRYVEQYTLFKMGTPRWEGRIVTSRWKAGAWKQTASKKVSLTAAKVKKYPGGFTGLTIVARP